MSQALPSHSYYPSLYTNAWRTERPYVAPAPVRYELVDAHGVPVQLPITVDFNGHPFTVDTVGEAGLVYGPHEHPDARALGVRRGVDAARFGWRVRTVTL